MKKNQIESSLIKNEKSTNNLLSKEPMIPGIYTLCSIGSRPTCRYSRTFPYQNRIAQNLPKYHYQ